MISIQSISLQKALANCTTVARCAVAAFLAAAAMGITPAAIADESRGAMTPRVGGTTAQPILMAQAGAASTAAGNLDALIKAAKAEGEFVYYIDLTENVAKSVSDAFSAKYGIKAQFIRLAGGAAVQQRYAAEADANNFAASMLITTNALPFAIEGIKRGWLEPVADAGLPVIQSGEFPARLNLGAVATVNISPWLITINTDKVKGDAIPKEWTDVLKPAFRGQILLPDPRVAYAYTDFWSLILEKHGPAFFEQLRAQNPRPYPSGVPAIQALAAGEGSLLFPAVAAQVAGTKAKGGPVDVANMSVSTGVEAMVMLTARAKARQPNSARLFANYVMSREGNTVLAGPGGVTVYDLSKLPSQYQAPKPAPANRTAEIAKLLGFQ